MIDTARLINILIESGSFIAAFAALSAGVVMAELTRKFGTGILADGFRKNSIGVFCIGLGIVIDAANSYLQINNFYSFLPNYAPLILLAIKEIFFVLGTYIIVIGSKKTGDSIESLIK